MTIGNWIVAISIFFVLSRLLIWSGKMSERGFREAGVEPMPGTQHSATIVWIFGIGIALVFFLWVAKGGG